MWFTILWRPERYAELGEPVIEPGTRRSIKIGMRKMLKPLPTRVSMVELFKSWLEQREDSVDREVAYLTGHV